MAVMVFIPNKYDGFVPISSLKYEKFKYRYPKCIMIDFDFLCPDLHLYQHF